MLSLFRQELWVTESQAAETEVPACSESPLGGGTGRGLGAIFSSASLEPA